MDKVTWFELPADDVARANDFYTAVFGWKTSDMGGGSRMAITTESDENGAPKQPGAINGDISPRSDSLRQPLVVVSVEDLDEKIKAVEAAGGKVQTPRSEVPGMNAAYAVVTDTEGNDIGVWQDL